MATVAMPERAGRTMEEAARLRDRLLFEERVELQVHAWQDRIYGRISAQIYNTMDDIDRLADAVLRL
jgi:isopenicillin-N epimerase